MSIEKLIIGTAQLGLDYGINNLAGKPSLKESISILKTAYKAGVRYLDTAEAYGDAVEIIGHFNNSGSERFHVISKFGSLNEDTNLEQNLTASLKKLNVSSIYAYLFHSPTDLNKLNSFPHIVSQIQQLKENGSIKKIGVSVYTNIDFKAAIENSLIDIIQFPFSVFDNNNKRLEMLKYAKEKGKEIHCRSVFLQGLIYKDTNTLPQKLKPLEIYIHSFHKIASGLNVPATELALNYALMNPYVDKVLIGIDSETQLAENLKHLASTLTENDLDRIDAAIDVTEEELLYPYNWK